MKPTAYNDGVVSIYREKDRKTDFNAKRNVAGLEDMDFIVKLAFDECSKRTQDLEFAEQSGFSLSLKVRTRYVPTVKTKHKAVIDGYLYEVSYLDKSEQELYLYLEGVRSLDSE
jgi:hypothetical protein